MINLTGLSPDLPLLISEEDFQRLSRKTKPFGWSQCETQEEWLCKLYYLRQGLRDKRISPGEFREKESQLVLNWWGKFA